MEFSEGTRINEVTGKQEEQCKKAQSPIIHSLGIIENYSLEALKAENDARIKELFWERVGGKDKY